jgi:chromosome segregation ATPase
LNYNETGSAAERTEADIRQVREQNAQLHKKLDSTHDLVKKLVSVVEDLGKQIDTLRGSKRCHDDIDTDRDLADDVAARKPAAATGITGKVGNVVNAMTRMMQAQKQQHQFSYTSLTLLGLKVADLIVLVAKHRLNLADKSPLGLGLENSPRTKPRLSLTMP